MSASLTVKVVNLRSVVGVDGLSYSDQTVEVIQQMV